MTPRQADPDRAAETEAAIVEAARDLLSEGGLEALSMRGLAARVGLSATAIYNYFENKGALVERVVLRGFERFGEYLRGSIADLPKGSRERLYALGEAYVRFALENREYFNVIFALHADPPREIEELPDGGGYHLLRETVAEAMEAGTIRRADADLVALYLWSQVHGLVTLSFACAAAANCSHHTGEEPDALELFARLSEFVIGGLLPDRESKPETGRVAVS